MSGDQINIILVEHIRYSNQSNQPPSRLSSRKYVNTQTSPYPFAPPRRCLRVRTPLSLPQDREKTKRVWCQYGDICTVLYGDIQPREHSFPRYGVVSASCVWGRIASLLLSWGPSHPIVVCLPFPFVHSGTAPHIGEREGSEKGISGSRRTKPLDATAPTPQPC
jgi:hypothetical protein